MLIKALIHAILNVLSQKKFLIPIFSIINGHAVGMAVVRPYSFEIVFGRNPISGSAAWFFFIILKFIFKSIYEIKIS